MPDVITLLKGIRKTLPAADQLAQALDLCSRDMVPDYFAFTPWLAEKIEAERHRVPVDDPLGARHSFVLSMVREFARLGNKMKRASEANPPDVKDFLKFKLFFSLFREDERGDAIIKNTLAAEELDDVQLTEGLASVTSATLRSRLFTAINRNRGHDAFLILGHLKEDDLDSGEYAFLRSLCHFRAGEFKEAIEYAKRVPLLEPDGPRAVDIRARSHAYLGDGDGVREAIAILERDALSPCQVLLLGELTAFHSGNVDMAGAAVSGHPVFVTTRWSSHPLIGDMATL
jgi:hypothetical protein